MQQCKQQQQYRRINAADDDDDAGKEKKLVPTDRASMQSLFELGSSGLWSERASLRRGSGRSELMQARSRI
jgi:hypothetical protein